MSVRLKRLSLNLLGLMALITSASAQTATAPCLQGEAVYTDDDGAWQIRFAELPEGLGIATNTFYLETVDRTVQMTGRVLWSNGVARPNADVTYQCPGGDITAEELDACRIWSGVPYTISGDGNVDLLDALDGPAAAAILLPNFGRTLRYSSIWTKHENLTVPWDVFRLSSCVTEAN